MVLGGVRRAASSGRLDVSAVSEECPGGGEGAVGDVAAFVVVAAGLASHNPQNPQNGSSEPPRGGLCGFCGFCGAGMDVERR